MSNKSLGNTFENEIAQYLFNNGFWVLRIPDGYTGQPVDIITVKNHKAYLIECKVCTTNVFNMSRIEPNQHATFRLWKETGNGEGYIAMKFGQDIFIISYARLCEMPEKRISKELIIQNGIRLEEWIKQCT